MEFAIQDFNFVITDLSLEKLTLTEVIAEYWKNCDIEKAVEDGSWKFYSKYKNLYLTNHFKTLVEEIYDKLGFLLPPPLWETAKHLVVPVGLHMCEWISLNKPSIDLLNLEDFLNSICWNSRGSIDPISSIDSWINKSNCEMLFERACYYCVEKQVNRMWFTFHEVVKTAWQNHARTQNHIMMNYWIHKNANTINVFISLYREYVKFLVNDENITDLQNVNLLMILLSLLSTNSCAFKYFYSKLPQAERSEKAMHYLTMAIYFEMKFNHTYCVDYLEIVHFLHPQMSKDQRHHMLHLYSTFYLFSMVIYWKYQSLLKPILVILENNLTTEMYCNALFCVAKVILVGGYAKPGLIKDAWYATSESFKRDLFQHIYYNAGLLLMFEGNVVDFNKIILTEITTEERNELLSFFEL